jgi:XisH protein
MAKDFYHENVRIALEKDGWKITDDPYRMKIEEVDCEMEKFGCNATIQSARS